MQAAEDLVATTLAILPEHTTSEFVQSRCLVAFSGLDLGRKKK